MQNADPMEVLNGVQWTIKKLATVNEKSSVHYTSDLTFVGVVSTLLMHNNDCLITASYIKLTLQGIRFFICSCKYYPQNLS